MNSPSLQLDTEKVCKLIKGKMRDGHRTVIAIAGPPASGKSSLAKQVVHALNDNRASQNPAATLMPMDGYHLDNEVLEANGLLARKGAPETFDSFGFCDAVRQVSLANRKIFLPRFDRGMDLSIASAIVVHPETPVVVVEGNYLLLKSDPWSSLRDIFSATVFVCPPMDTLRDRLNERWVQHGFDPEEAALKATGNDLVNAELVIRESFDADLKLNQDYTKSGSQNAY